ncbi:MAG: hypothetical protein KAI24_21540, partial [Planctomycetes bacterium]|nr:hypothetical protein [Planctomycetota bacterium]
PNGRRLPFVLASSEPGAPDLCVVPLHLPRYERLIVEPDAIVWRGAPEAGHAARVGFYFWPSGKGHRLLPHLQRLVDAIDRPLPVDLGPDGKASLTSDLPLAHSRLLHVGTDGRALLLVRERGYWTWRACQPASGGGSWLRVHQEPGDVVEVVGGPVVFARTRPGTGALRCVALQDPTPREVTAVVLQRSRLRAPSVVMAADFDEVTVDGEPWSWFDGRTVYLPDEPGSYRIETHLYAAEVRPHVRATAAPLTRCAFDPKARELVLVTAPDAERPAGLPWTAVLHGPLPSSIDNGEVVAIGDLHLPDAAAEAAAREGGVLIRFRPGTTTLRYEAWNASPGR